MKSSTKNAGSLEIGKGKVMEICSEITKGQSLNMQFNANRPVSFNLHFHNTYNNEIALISKPSLSKFKHKSTLESTQEYCLMWTGLSNDTTVIYEYAFQ